jgi:predicted dehydrogenase
MARELKIGIVGLDTSHTVAFTQLMQGASTPVEQRIEGMRVAHALRFPSPFQDEKGQDGRQAEMEALGVVMKTSVADVAQGMDALFLEINDPALHLQFFRQVAGLGLPIFLDKPLAADLATGRQLVELAQAKRTNVWSSSSLRYTRRLVAARKQMTALPTLCSVFGALGKAAAGSDIVWYGCHVTEMLVTSMGLGAQSVMAVEDPAGVVAVVTYPNGRRAVAEYNRGSYTYGGRVQAGGEVLYFDNTGDLLYYNLLIEIKRWLDTGALPVTLEESLEVQAIMEAVERSLAQKQAVDLATL